MTESPAAQQPSICGCLVLIAMAFGVVVLIGGLVYGIADHDADGYNCGEMLDRLSEQYENYEELSLTEDEEDWYNDHCTAP